MLQGRVLCRISLVIILLIAISAYAPWDFLGVYDKAEAAALLEEGQWAKAKGYIYHKEIKKDKVLYYVKNASVTTGSGSLSNTSFIFKLESDIIPNYSKVNIEGKVKHFSAATNEGCFDMKNYYNSLGLYLELTDIGAYDYSCNSFVDHDYGFKIRQRISSVYEVYLLGEEAGFLSSVVIGEKSGLDTELKTLFQNVGIAHILAVSGLHISVICMAVYKMLRKRGVGFLLCGTLAGMVAVCYGLVTGGSVSSVRAIGMFLIYLVAQITGECYDMPTAMAVVADILLLGNPLYIKNGSFIFSFGAVIGIYFIVLPLNNAFTNYFMYLRRSKKSHDKFYADETWLHKVIQYICSSLVFSFGMFVAMLPLVTQLYYQTPLYSVFLNLLVLPIMPVVLGTGLIAGIIGACAGLGSSALIGWKMFPALFVKILLFICHCIIYQYELLSDFVQRLPGSTMVVGYRSMWTVVIYYLILLFIVYGLDYITKNINSGKKVNQRNSLLLKAGAFIFIAILWLHPQKGEFEIDILDVGQGDGIYINSGDGARFFIDGGSTSSDAVGQYTLMPFLKYKGVGSIDYWFITHMDLDHVSGVLELLERGYQIDNIVLSAEIPEGETLSQLLALAEHNDTNVLYMKQGDECGTRNLSFTCVYPYSGMVSDDVNDLSLCLLMEYENHGLFSRETEEPGGFFAFFGGDIAAEQERAIASSGFVDHVDLLKVSHHGSRFSSDSDFLSALSPDVAVISCAKINRYGHPSAEAIERLEAAAGSIYYTMNSGRVRVNAAGVDEYISEKLF
ncbi:DNA internalization-related competence protein ComEC/Rec2 [Butyrivibrio fibrisolvens]|uniref:DNA internalization-related competence protein ComEC/Rec2 n=1 Tax=Pseudobutyrivibrio ruminis TaxID=46206 RepID=UPI00040E594A|nr:DNA internalization-related competence protein ComEC/Rec2 [Pseudobutyrivibrio ruminis]MDC7278157.1 DNA internalization-related competence protein ComEC/Rec2 [Butyrivibrio fibrisolvens]